MLKTVQTRSTWTGGMRVDAQAREHNVIIDQPRDFGGSDAGANPMEHFLFALGSCLGTVAAIVARQEQIELRNFAVEIEGDFDVDYLMGKTKEGRAGFTEIRASVYIDADMTPEEKADFFSIVDSRCPVTGSILNDTSINFVVK